IDLAPVELARRVQALGARTVIYTDAARDGTLTGPDLVGARAIAALGLDVIVSGGVAWLDDLRRAAAAGLAGAIVGRALHERRFTLAGGLACVAGCRSGAPRRARRSGHRRLGRRHPRSRRHPARPGWPGADRRAPARAVLRCLCRLR